MMVLHFTIYLLTFLKLIYASCICTEEILHDGSCHESLGVVGVSPRWKPANATNQDSSPLHPGEAEVKYLPAHTSASSKKELGVSQGSLQIRSNPSFPCLQTRFYMRVSPYYQEAELNFVTVFWPSLPHGLQAAYEVAYRDEVRFFKGNAASNYFSVSTT